MRAYIIYGAYANPVAHVISMCYRSSVSGFEAGAFLCLSFSAAVRSLLSSISPFKKLGSIEHVAESSLASVGSCSPRSSAFCHLRDKMADRIPLEKPSLSHTSQEPEGLAWAQIGTNLANGGKQASEKSAVQDATADKEPEEDAGSEVDLRVDEDAQPEEENEAVADVSMEATEESEEAGEKEGESGDGKSEEGQGDVDDTSAGSKKRTAEDEEEEKKKTNSHNPRRIKARVFVGHLNTDRCSREDVEKLFEPHGKILGVSLQKGYGFVQFEDEEGARRAVKEVHGQHFFGMKIGNGFSLVFDSRVLSLHDDK